jgi:methyl-accepting chemotaxis protein
MRYLLFLMTLAGCTSLHKMNANLEANIRVVESSTETLAANVAILNQSTEAIENNKEVVIESTQALRENASELHKVTAMMEALSSPAAIAALFVLFSAPSVLIAFLLKRRH